LSAKELGVLFALGAIWGASFMFIKLGGAEIEPFALVEMRLGLAALVMIAIVAGKPDVRRAMLDNWRPLVVMGLLNCAVPYTLLTWGELYISSGLAAIYNSTSPLWVVALGFFWAWAEKLTPVRLVGTILGFLGVVLAVSGNLAGSQDGNKELLGHAAVLLMALSYAVASIFGRKMLKGVPSLAPATGQLITGALMLLPLAAFQVPKQMPSFEALAAVGTLSIVGTALASLMYYWLLSRVGAARVLLVTYLLPGFALLWGALFLREEITLTALAGLALILLGVTVTSGRGAPVFAWVRSRLGRAPAGG
jgi:drug/metabolite transporter (DMT)-like permease